MEVEAEKQKQEQAEQEKKTKKRRRQEDPTDFVHRVQPPEAKRRRDGKPEGKKKKPEEEIDILALNELKKEEASKSPRTAEEASKSPRTTEEASATETSEVRPTTEESELQQQHQIHRQSFETLSKSLFMSLPVSAPFLVETAEVPPPNPVSALSGSDKRKRIDSPSKLLKTLSANTKKRYAVHHFQLFRLSRRRLCSGFLSLTASVAPLLAFSSLVKLFFLLLLIDG